jgi:hypothetical protein
MKASSAISPRRLGGWAWRWLVGGRVFAGAGGGTLDPSTSSGFRLRAPASLTPAKRLKLVGGRSLALSCFFILFFEFDEKWKRRSFWLRLLIFYLYLLYRIGGGKWDMGSDFIFVVE